ncbi:hypothetical protein HMPREF1631_06400 [Arcanobacterium sp. S3PF19]|nr:hypothetical protein HMPREF1631_06400 [Arcanobacterium sp. S3PF19]
MRTRRALRYVTNLRCAFAGEKFVFPVYFVKWRITGHSVCENPGTARKLLQPAAEQRIYVLRA